jgi:hypothetical protein
VVGRVTVFTNDNVFRLLRGRQAIGATYALRTLPVKLNITLVALTIREFKAVNVVFFVARRAVEYLFVFKNFFTEVTAARPAYIIIVNFFYFHDSCRSNCAISK